MLLRNVQVNIEKDNINQWILHITIQVYMLYNYNPCDNYYSKLIYNYINYNAINGNSLHIEVVLVFITAGILSLNNYNYSFDYCRMYQSV